MSISNGKTSSDIENAEWNSTGMLGHTRYGSSSSQASQSSGDICRICHCESDPQNPLLTPCYCSGSLKFVHQTCLQQWLTASETNACELCKFPFIMHTKIKPFNEWRSLEMSGVERRRLFCAVLFHCAAALCVIWSLCVLIERAAEEVRRGLIGWPFWTKLVVVTVGLTGGVVFMYIQCKQYLNLCNRWRARNRILLIQNAPEKIQPPQSPVIQQFRRVRTAATSGVGLVGSGSGTGPGQGSVSVNSAILTGHGSIRSGYDHHTHHHHLIGSIGSAAGVSGSGGGHHCELQINQQGQIIAANIENSSISYDRDWTLDDISQVSFKPCLQGSGSLTPMPFHDSAHNICEGSGSGGSGVVIVSNQRYSAISGSSNTVHEEEQMQQQQQQQSINRDQNSGSCSSSIKTADLNLFRMPNAELSSVNGSNSNINAGVAPESLGSRHPNSALFLENRDILNDPPCHDQIVYPSKLYNRRSTVLGSNGVQYDQDEPRRDARRYSDTKLLQQQRLTYVNELPNAETLSPTKDQLLLNPKSIIYDMNNFLGPVVKMQDHQEVSPTKSNQHKNHHHRHHHHHPLASAESPSHLLQTTDIQFGSNCDEETPRPTLYDPLELNIQEMLELDIANIQRLQQKQHSLGNISQHSPTPSVYNYFSHYQSEDNPSSPLTHSVDLPSSPVLHRTLLTSNSANPRILSGGANQTILRPYYGSPPTHIINSSQQPQQQPQHLIQAPREGSSVGSSGQCSTNRLKLFKSLPNLSASSENLLPPPKRFD
ncbi:uncharacterized protein LOC129751681 [Uranotaenia lowii]|uniref:uncharacterized protein LOC129751681 n=1 Tax=Uranotaenia lowii TaxID=190385 RepID=UPI00247A93F5|nr:uncharacterized protein LOC129751681 [Uranotaenia lowii]XP_055603313.1 uncharacterized protein LOC129751681 [Uranotaenia lowii]